MQRLPAAVGSGKEAIYRFNCAIVDATADLVCAYKPQAAYYHAVGAERELEATIAYIHDKYPNVPVILDAKRNDIGSTAKQYAKEAFERYGADAVTVNPYMGGDTIEPFTESADRGVFILCRTSNPGSGDLQNLSVGPDGSPVFEVVARSAAGSWNKSGNIGLVVGATYIADLRRIRSIAPDLPLLVPGVGAQGGDLREVLDAGLDARKAGLIINASRSVLYASDGRDFAEQARHEAQKLRDTMQEVI